jgi:hypothetical protein
MAEEELADAEVAAQEAQLLAAMPAKGSISNGALRSELGWDEPRYFYIRNKLFQAGKLRNGRGRSVQLVVQIAPQNAGAAPSRTPESDLYAPIIGTLGSQWVLDHQIQDWIIDLTAHQGRRDTGGKWTRPDITLGTRNTYVYAPITQIELNTFEVKTHDGLDVTAVYEALAHRRAAHYSYVLACVPEEKRDECKDVIERLGDDAHEHGIGLVVIENPNDYDSWNFEVEPELHEPEPAELDKFIRTQSTKKFQEKFVAWCRQR